MHKETREFEKLQELFELVVDLPEGDRQHVLEQLCDDPKLRLRVLAILAGAERPEEIPLPSESLPLGGRIGPYRLLKLLGSGGLGSVYLAERLMAGAPYRLAIKILGPHAAGPFFVDRFQREQHILASLDHPRITKMIDAGMTDGGQPYLAMEYVQGQHLDAHCDERRLAVEDRIRLMLQVCDAVGYAHRNLVVHLDLKPSNILVTDDGAVKLLDFGTSKLIEPDSLLTTTLLATPAFASPEQLRNEGVTTACDIYTLGVILYALLAGDRPGGKASASMRLERALSEAEPEQLDAGITEDAATLRGVRSAQLRQILKGDLAFITAKCLRPRARDRYLSVDALADDLQRYLDGRPVLATSQTTAYRVSKFVRRNWKAVVATGIAALLLLSTVAYAVVRQQQALREAHRAIQMQNFMAQVFKLANTNVMGKPAATVPEFLKLWSAVLPRMIKDPADQRAGQISLGESMFFDADYSDAETLLDRVIAEAKDVGDVPAEAEAEAYAGMVAYKLGKIPKFTALSSHALHLADRSGITPEVRVWIKTFYTYNRYELDYVTADDVRIQRSAYKEAHDPRVPPDELAYAANVLALVISRSSPIAEQRSLAREAIAIYQHEPYGFCEGGMAEELLAFLQNQAGEKAASLETIRNTYQTFKQCRGEDNYETLVAQSGLGFALFWNGDTQNALKMFESAIDSLTRVHGTDGMALSIPLSGLARTYNATGQYKKAEETSARLFHVLDGKVNPQSNQLGMTQMIWAQALEGEGEIDEALKHARIADAGYRAGDIALPATVSSKKRIHELLIELEAKAENGKK